MAKVVDVAVTPEEVAAVEKEQRSRAVVMHGCA